MRALPDYLRGGLRVVFVGINPGRRSAEAGHYFASPRNRFWPAVNGSGLLSEELSAETDSRVLEFGIGLTDVVKRPTAGASDVTAVEFRRSAPILRGKIERYAPGVVCFLGIVGCRSYARYAHGPDVEVSLGLQSWRIGNSRVFVAPSPSPANAAYSLQDITGWLARLKRLSDDL